MKKNAKKPKSSFRGKLLKIAVALASAYLVVSFVSGQLEVSAKQHQLAEITAQVEQQAEKNIEMQAMMDAENEDAYIERVAREKLGYAYPNERVFIDISGE